MLAVPFSNQKLATPSPSECLPDYWFEWGPSYTAEPNEIILLPADPYIGSKMISKNPDFKEEFLYATYPVNLENVAKNGGVLFLCEAGQSSLSAREINIKKGEAYWSDESLKPEITYVFRFATYNEQTQKPEVTKRGFFITPKSKQP